MRPHEYTAIRESAREVLERHGVAEEKLPAILRELTHETQTALDEARQSWAHDIRISA